MPKTAVFGISVKKAEEMGMTKEKKVPKTQVQAFKIKNRKGYAVICKNNLTEGKTLDQGLDRMNKALKRIGFTLG